MERIKLLCLSYILLWAGFEQAYGSKFIIKRISGTLFVDLLKLPTQTHQFEIGPNELEDIGPGAICTTPALQIVKIDFSKTPKPPILRPDMFKNCENLLELWIDGNKQQPTEWKGGVLQHFANLKILRAKHSSIHRLTRDFFNGANSLFTLSFHRCGIEEISSGSFDNLRSLENLSLKRNEIALLPKSLFQNLANLKTLDLSKNKISVLGGGAFDGLSSLESLDLSSNQIAAFVDQILRSAFDDLKNLKRLTLRSNKISSLPTNLFRNLSEMKKLDLSFNNITELSWDEVEGLSSLETLNFQFSKVSFFDADKIFKHMPNLKEIIVDGSTGNCTVVQKSARKLKSKFGHVILKSDTLYVDDYYDEQSCYVKSEDDY